jgi:POT family proton-dependent oligopeptide transporter
MGINTGAFVGQLITGVLGEKVGWHWGFGAAGAGMLIGLLIYIIRGPKTLGNIGMQRTRDPDPAVQTRRERNAKLILAGGLGLLSLVIVLAASGVVALDPQAIGRSMTYVLVGMAVVYFIYIFVAGRLNTDEKKRVGVIFILFVFAAIFWSAFEQQPTSLNLFARDFTDRRIGAFEVPATWFQSINSLFIILLAPAFAAVWVALGRRGGDLSSPAKFALGLFFTAVGFLIMLWAANTVVTGGPETRVSPMWLIGSYFFQTLGELSLSPVGLSSMTKLSPRKYIGQMMGIWFLATAVGNLIAGLVGGDVDPNRLEQMPRLFTTTAIWLIGSGAVLAILIVPIRRMMAGVR